MNRLWLPAALLVATLLAMAGSLLWAQSVLPPQVASHFDPRGQPDAWMTRNAHLGLMAAIGIGMPLFLLVVFWGVRFLPASLVNIPHREHWLSAAQRPETLRILLRYGVWLAWIEALLVLGVHALVVQANVARPVRLSALAWALLGTFLVAMGIWLWRLLARFRRLA